MGKSARKKPRLPKVNPKADEEPQFVPAPIISSSDDEADDDLSLKIVEKAMLRGCGSETNGNSSSSSLRSQVINAEVKKTSVRKKKIKAKDNDVENVETKEEGGVPKETEATLGAQEEGGARKETEATLEMQEGGTPKETAATLETNPTEKSDNIVLRKLLRGPRYFDPPDSGWDNCYNCGEGGHTAANCTSAKRQRPCFVCGSLEHNVKQCDKGKDCFICKKVGHRAKDCPEKSIRGSQNAKICLKCGGSGHDMLSCKSIYSPDDLKEIQCYVCKCFGHLCCISYADSGPREVSCYRCGISGHSGWECGRVQAETTSTGTPSSCYKCGEEGHIARKCPTSAKAEPTSTRTPSSCYKCGEGGHIARKCHISAKQFARVQTEPTSTGTPSSCYKCGEEGHIARYCPTSAKNEKRKSEFLTPRKNHPRDNYKNHKGGWPIPHDLGNARKRNKTHYGQPQSKPKVRGGWMTEHPSDYNQSWGSPKTPVRYVFNNDRFHGGSGYTSGFHSNGRTFHYDNTVGSNGYHHRFSGSRFGNSSSYRKRDFGWDY